MTEENKGETRIHKRLRQEQDRLHRAKEDYHRRMRTLQRTLDRTKRANKR